MAGKAEVRLTLATSDYQTLQALLQYQAQKISEDEFKAILRTLQYTRLDENQLDRVIVYIAESLSNAIK